MLSQVLGTHSNKIRMLPSAGALHGGTDLLMGTSKGFPGQGHDTVGTCEQPPPDCTWGSRKAPGGRGNPAERGRVLEGLNVMSA